MNRKADLTSIEEAYKNVIGEPPGKKAATQQMKPGKSKDKTWSSMAKNVKDIPVGNDKTTKGFVQSNSGPGGADNYKSAELDPENEEIKDDNAYSVKQSSAENADTYFKAKNKKIARENINTSMAKNKSIFDRLYEEVMDDEQFDAVELGVGDDEAGGDDFGEAEDQVTITLDKDLAQKLHEVLMGVLEGDDDLGDEADDLGDEADDLGDDAGDVDFEEMEEEDEAEQDDEEEEDFNYFGEEIEAEDLGTPLHNQKKGNATSPKGKENVVKTSHTSSVGSKGGDGKVTDKVGNDGDEGHPLVNQKKGKSTSPKGRANVVNSKVKGGNQEFFQKNS